jgi:DNA-directed RNA polymerase alpha subunit
LEPFDIRLSFSRKAKRTDSGPNDVNEAKMSELAPTPELPDDTPLERVRLPARIRKVLDLAGLKTVGDVREISDDTLLSFQDFGKGSVALIRETLGLPSSDGVRADGRGPKVNGN